MDGVLGMTGGGVGSSGGSSSGSLTTVSKDDNLVMVSEVSSYPDESELDLGLGLSLGGGCGKAVPGTWRQYGRILTAKDLPAGVSHSSASSSSSSSCSSSLSKANVSAGTKRSADSVAAASGVNQVVGWPPIRAQRINSLVNLAKSPPTGEYSILEKSESKNTVVENSNNGNAKENGHIRTSLFVKVNMDGIPIGRKVDLNAHSCYESLAQTLEDMFCKPTSVSETGSCGEIHDAMVDATRPSKLLDVSSEFVLTYEDKDGDWMLVGDVPWRMFLTAVKRLRIMRTSEANGLAPRFEEMNRRQRSKPI